jgi:hypothetical protein
MSPSAGTEMLAVMAQNRAGQWFMAFGYQQNYQRRVCPLRAKTNGNALFNFGLVDKRIYHCDARFGCLVQNAGGTRSMPMLLTGHNEGRFRNP